MSENKMDNLEVLQPPVEIIEFGSESFAKLKDEMYISDRYEKIQGEDTYDIWFSDPVRKFTRCI